MALRGINRLIEKGETQNLEFTTDTLEVGKSICSFANTNDGILIGVSDNGEIKRCSPKDEQRIANTAHTCKPSIYPEIEKVDVDGKIIFIVRVKKSGSSVDYAYKNVVYKRVGTHDKPLSPGEVIEFARDIGEIRFDSQICEEASLGDIDWTFVEDFFILEYERIAETKLAGNAGELLEALECIMDDKPTNAGILLFGKNPQRFFMNSYIALARYKGKEVGTERLDYKKFDGNLFRQIDNCDRYIKEHTAVMSRLHPMRVRREDIPEYPLFAIRELVVNTVCHRDYFVQESKVIVKMFDDHIEYYNPGGLPLGITPENITGKQFSRNRVIANVLSKVQYIEKLGEGWDKILREHRIHPLNPKMPKIESDEFSTLVTLFSSKEKFEEERGVELNKRQENALEYLKDHRRITNREYQKINKTSRETAKRELSDLVKKGVLKQIGSGRGTFYQL